MRAEEYLKDPCRASSLPFWKTEQLILPRGVTVIRDDLYTAKPSGPHGTVLKEAGNTGGQSVSRR